MANRILIRIKRQKGNTSSKEEKGMSKTVKFILGAGVLVLVFFGYRFMKGEEAVDGVRDTHFEAYEEATVGELFEQYFKETNWVYEKEQEQVVFTGSWDKYDASQDIKICFAVEREDDGEYYTISSNVESCELDGEEIDEELWSAILEDVIDSYEEE